MSKSIKFNRILKLFSWSLLSLVVLIILLVSLALSSVGTRWGIDYVNDSDLGVAIDYKSGSLYSQLDLQQVRIAQEGLDVHLNNVSLDVKLSCLFVAEVCIEHIRLEKVHVALGDMPEATQPAKETPNSLITLPVLVALDELSVGELVVSQHDFEMLKAKKFSVALSFLEQLNITSLSTDSIVFNLPKAIEVAEPEPVANQSANKSPRPWLKELANFTYQPISIPQVFIPINADLQNAKLANICVRQQLEDDSFSSLFCNENLAIKLALKNQKLDSTFVLSNISQNSATPSFTPSNLKFKATINFAKNFEHEVTLQALKMDTPISALPTSKSKKTALKIDTPIFNDSKGFYFKSKGDINQLEIAVTHLPSQSKAIAINTAIQLHKSALPVTLDFKFEPLPAEALNDVRAWLPTISKEAVAQIEGVSVLTAKVNGDMQGYRVTALASTAPISGIENVEMNALIKPNGGGRNAWSLIDIAKLQVSGDIGTFDFLGKADIETIANKQTQLSWQGNLELDSLQLAKIDASLDSMISGAVPHQFSMTETTQSGSVANARLKGNWQNLPLLLVADAELEKTGNVNVKSVQLNQGDNEISIQGSLYSQQALASLAKLGASFTGGSKKSASSLDFLIDIKSLAELYPELNGQLNAKGNISGPIEIPKIVMQANIQELTVGDIELEEANADLSVNMANKLKSAANIQAINLFAGGQNIPIFNLQLDGDESEQSLRLSIPEGQYVTEQFFKGQLNADNSSWSGEWLEGKVVSSLAELILQDTPALTLNLQPFSLFLAQHCWEGRGDKLCISDIKASQQNAKTKIELDYNVMNPGMADLLPSVDVMASDLDVNIDVDVYWQKLAGLSFSADIFSQNASLVSNDNKVNIENIIAKVEGTPSNISSRFTFDSTQAGQVALNSQLDLNNKPYRHKGDVVITDFAVSYFAPFITAVKRLNGDINANITFEGPIEKPALQGKLSLVDGAFVLKEYPLRLANYNQDVTFNGSKADFAGSFTLGEGDGSINGDIDFTDKLIVNTQVQGDELGIAYESYQFKVSPDIQLNLQPELLTVTGKVEVPFARVKIKTLPPSAKSPTQDIIIVDEKQVVKQTQIPLDVRVNILIDKAKKGEVKLDALDLKAELSGDLNVQVDAQNTRVNGSVQILKGDYAAYGQVLQIRKGEITFSGQPDVPAFDIEAIRNPLNTKDNVVAGIRVSGNAIKPSVELFSEPSMEQARQLSYLISGADSFGAGGGPSDSNTALVNALVSFGVGKSENGIGSLGQKLGVRDLNLQTAGQGGDTKVQLSGQLAEGVKVTYGVGVFDSLSEISVHYQLMPKLYLEAVSGVNNTLDLYYQITSKD